MASHISHLNVDLNWATPHPIDIVENQGPPTWLGHPRDKFFWAQIGHTFDYRLPQHPWNLYLKTLMKIHGLEIRNSKEMEMMRDDEIAFSLDISGRLF